MTTTQKAIIRTLLYFDLFNHPLNSPELYALIGIKAEKNEFEEALKELLSNDIISGDSGYYFLNNGHSPINERQQKLELAVRYYRIARFISRLIWWHPFVRAVMVSGSLSKHAVNHTDDIDFFIIAEPGRVWVSRMFLMIFKKLFLFNSKKYFCINYFIDSGNLEIPEKNIFTATELAFLFPLVNTPLCADFIRANEWILRYFPNKRMSIDGCREMKEPCVKRVLEWFLDGKPGNRLDTYFMKLYRKRSLKRYGETDKQRFEINFKSEQHVAKYHPNGFQHRVLDQYSLRIADFEVKHRLDLTV